MPKRGICKLADETHPPKEWNAANVKPLWRLEMVSVPSGTGLSGETNIWMKKRLVS